MEVEVEGSSSMTATIDHVSYFTSPNTMFSWFHLDGFLSTTEPESEISDHRSDLFVLALDRNLLLVLPLCCGG